MSQYMHTNGDKTSGGGTGYETPRLTVHGSVAEVTQAFLVGAIVDKNFAAGNLIIGNTSL
jgi:hypothetical protein